MITRRRRCARILGPPGPSLEEPIFFLKRGKAVKWVVLDVGGHVEGIHRGVGLEQVRGTVGRIGVKLRQCNEDA